VTAASRTFAHFEGCFSGEEGTVPVPRRGEFAAEHAGRALMILSALRSAIPDLYRDFLNPWQG
jgi:hypothetical protein